MDDYYLSSESDSEESFIVGGGRDDYLVISGGKIASISKSSSIKSNENDAYDERSMKESIDNICSSNPNSRLCYLSKLRDEIKSTELLASTCESAENCELAILRNATGICNPQEVLKYLDSESIFINNEIKDNILSKYNKNSLPSKPLGPRSSNKWLSDGHINGVLSKLEKESGGEYYNFTCTLMNFNEKVIDNFINSPNERKLRNISKVISENIKKIKCYGCVMNTDTTHDCKGNTCGSHWVCIFIDCRKMPDTPWTVEYFDSVGDPPPDLIVGWLNKLVDDLHNLRNNLCETGGVNLECNRIGHQRKNTECGVYCCYYISSRVTGVPHSRFQGNPIQDHIAAAYRPFLFKQE